MADAGAQNGHNSESVRQDLQDFATAAGVWTPSTSDRLLAELQKLSAWMLDSVGRIEANVIDLESETKRALTQLHNAGASLTGLAQTRAVIQVNGEVNGYSMWTWTGAVWRGLGHLLLNC